LATAVVAAISTLVVACSILPTPTIPPQIHEALARTNVTVEPASADDSPGVSQEAALAAAQADADASGWPGQVERPYLARLLSLGSLEGIDPADHPLVWVTTSRDGPSELLLVVSATDGEVIASQVTTLEGP
jgi:hypothetical protein